jgi:DNA repair protein RecO (recombination protein O)
MKQKQATVLILNRLDFGEADKIIHALSSEGELLTLLAKGVRRQKSKLRGGLELFSECAVTYIDGKSDMKTVISTKLTKHFGGITKDIKRTMVAYDILKNSRSFLQYESSSAYYELLLHGFEGLQDPDVNPQLVYSWFVFSIFSLSGSGVNLEKPMNQQSFESGKTYELSLEDMTLFESDNGRISSNCVKFMRIILQAKKPNKLQIVEGYSEYVSALEPVARSLIQYHRT